jgi:hypothetical protein
MLDLNKFCSKSMLRMQLHLPWSVGDFSFATNGYIIVRVPGRPNIAGRDDAPKAEKLFADHLSGKAPTGSPPDISAFKSETCPACLGSGAVMPCDDCEGEGVTHGEECDACEGEGLTAIPDGEDPKDQEECLICDGSGSVFDLPRGNHTSVEVAPGHYVAARYLAVLNSLPSTVWNIADRASDSPIPFWFDGGDGLLMPTRIPEGHQKTFAVDTNGKAISA